MTAPQITDLWLEYETCSSPEARVAKNLDKFEMILQADEVRERERFSTTSTALTTSTNTPLSRMYTYTQYERAQGKDLSDFFRSTEGKFDHPEVMEWDALLRANRAAK